MPALGDDSTSSGNPIAVSCDSYGVAFLVKTTGRRLALAVVAGDFLRGLNVILSFGTPRAFQAGAVARLILQSIADTCR